MCVHVCRLKLSCEVLGSPRKKRLRVEPAAQHERIQALEQVGKDPYDGCNVVVMCVCVYYVFCCYVLCMCPGLLHCYVLLCVAMCCYVLCMCTCTCSVAMCSGLLLCEEN